MHTIRPNRVTIDLTEENRHTLEQIKSDRRIPYGRIINGLIEALCDLPEDAKKNLMEVSVPKLHELYQLYDDASHHEHDELLKNIRAYTNLIAFLNYGRPVTRHEIMHDIQRIRES